MIIENLIEDHKIEVSDDDIEQEMAKIADENSVGIEEVRKNYQEERALFYLKEEIKERRVNDILLSENKIIEGKRENYLDFMSENS
jgi:trigger factor